MAGETLGISSEEMMAVVGLDEQGNPLAGVTKSEDDCACASVPVGIKPHSDCACPQ